MTVEPSERDQPQQPDSVDVDQTAMFGEEDTPLIRRQGERRMPGDTFGRYRIQKTLGEGSMGSVYLAHDTQLDRKVALKIPKVDAKEDGKFIERFLREARSAATLTHPNICSVYDVGEIDGTNFITMAYIHGRTLSEFIDPEKPQPDRTVAIVVRKIALGLHEAHINGMVHRDVKPGNIMIDHRNEPIIMDFGLARYIDDADDARLTRDGAILGSPAYMSPEQVEGKFEKIGPACDIYSLGVILFELLTGQLPFQGSVASIIGQIIAKEPPLPTSIRPDISPRLAEICQRAMAKRIEERFRSMKEFAAALADFIKNPDVAQEKVETLEPAKPERKRISSGDSGILSGKIEVTCKCGQKLVANKEFAGKMVKCPRCGDAVPIPGPKPIDVACQGCGQRFEASGNLEGKVVKCPMCSRPITVPKRGAAQSLTRQIEVNCTCGQQFVATPNLAGKKVRCTTCGNLIRVPVG